VHSNEQIRASAASGGRSRSQHSQLGRSSSMTEERSPGRAAAQPGVAGADQSFARVTTGGIGASLTSSRKTSGRL
jgi:hypothetical protein